MNVCWFIFTVIILPIFGAQSGNETNFEKLAVDLLNLANKPIDRYWYRLRDLFLTSNRKFNQINHAPLYQDILTNYKQFSTQLAYNLSTIPPTKINNTLIKRRVEILNKLQLMGLDMDDYDKSKYLLRTMNSMATSKIVPHYKCTTSDCTTRVSRVPDINDIISKSRTLDELEFYWTSWRKETNELSRRSFVDFINLFRKAAALNGHVAPSKTWYLYYEDHKMLSEFENAITELMPLYTEFHAYMRNVLREKYGQHLIPKNGLIPQHLMEQIIQHAWKPRSIFSPPYPDKKLPDVKHKMEHFMFTPLKINELAAQFFESMGMHELPTTFWIKYARKMSDEEANHDCKAEVFNFPPDVALKYCPKVDFKKFLQMHGHMAEIQYNIYKGRLPFGIDREACPGFASAIGEASIISASSPNYLEKINLIENYTMDSELSLNRLFRLGVHTIFTIPLHFINEKFIVDSLDNQINEKDLNCKYWTLQDKFAGISPPSKRSESNFDPGYQFYNRLDPAKPNTIKLISEMLGYQIYKSLCQKSKQYVAENTFSNLYNCDFSGDKEIGKVIIKAMSYGSTYHWRDVLEVLTNERTISSKAILDYYEPLYIWLKNYNEKHAIDIGWESVINCEP